MPNWRNRQTRRTQNALGNHRGSSPRLGTNIRVLLNGRASPLQGEDAGSIPVTRSKIAPNKENENFPLNKVGSRGMMIMPKGRKG